MSPGSNKAFSAAASALLALVAIAVASPIAAAHPGRHVHHRPPPRHRPLRRRPANLALRLSGSTGPVTVGAQVTYTATVVNVGGRRDDHAGLRDLVPAGASLVSTSESQGSCGAGPVILCSLGPLARGASATVTIVVTAGRPGRMTDYAWVSTDPPGRWRHRHAVSTMVQGTSSNVDLKLSESPGNLDTGQQATYTATVSNDGNAAAPSVAFQDLLPGKASLVSTAASQGSCGGNPVLVCSLGSLSAGASATVTVVVTANQPGWMIDHAWISANSPGKWQRERTVRTWVRNASPRLALRLAGSPGAVSVGQQVTYTATVADMGSAAAADAGFQDLLASGTNLVSVTPSQGTCSGNPTLSCDLGSLAPGGSATITIVVVPDRPGTILDRGWVSNTPPGGWVHERAVATDVHPAPLPPTTTTAAPASTHM